MAKPNEFGNDLMHIVAAASKRARKAAKRLADVAAGGWRSSRV